MDQQSHLLDTEISRPRDEFFTLRPSDVNSEASNESDNQFLVLSEDHFSELAEDELDSEGLPLDKRDVERAIRRYIRLIRLDETDANPDKKKKLIIRLCQLKIRLNQMNEEQDEKYFNGHRLSRPKSSPSSSGSSSTFATPDTTSSLVCDVCIKKQMMILLPPGLFKSYQPNVLLVCDFCDFKIHRNCISTKESKTRTCPRLLFQQEQDDQDDQSSPTTDPQQSQRPTTSTTTSNHESSPDGGSVTSKDRKTFTYSRYVEFTICPEVGLAKQDFKCAECRLPIQTLSNARLCDYDGLYYCFKCHWNDMERTPARLLHNWDSTPRPLSRRSLQIVNYIKRKPVLFDVLDFNPMLYGLVEDLPFIKRLRLELSQMAQYIRLCRQPNKPRLSVIPSYLINEDESNGGNAFSFSDLLSLDHLKRQLIELHGHLLTHITHDCQGCQGKGFYCDHCRDKTDLLFPFTANTSSCPDCGTVFHRICYHRKHQACLRCQRRKAKREKDELVMSNEEFFDGMSESIVSETGSLLS